MQNHYTTPPRACRTPQARRTMPLRAAAMTVVRQLYDRARELGLDATGYALLNPFRKGGPQGLE